MVAAGSWTSVLDSALSRPYSGYHVPISRKAAALLHSVVKNHAFVDGNKRTAWQVTDLLLRRSGYDLEVKPDDWIDDMVVAVADNRMDFDEIVQWFKQRIIRVGK